MSRSKTFVPIRPVRICAP